MRIILDGTEYTSVPNTSLYIQLDDARNQNELQGCYIAADADERVPVSVVGAVEEMEYAATFAKMPLHHFSPYAFFDKTEPVTAELPKTSDDSSVILWSVLAVLSIACMMLVRKTKAA